MGARFDDYFPDNRTLPGANPPADAVQMIAFIDSDSDGDFEVEVKSSGTPPSATDAPSRRVPIEQWSYEEVTTSTRITPTLWQLSTTLRQGWFIVRYKDVCVVPVPDPTRRRSGWFAGVGS